MVWVLIALAIGSDIAYPGFFAPSNLAVLLAQIAPEGIVAVGVTFVIIGGGFDLSVSALFAAGAVFYASFAGDMPLWLAFIATATLAVAAGVMNGLVITRLKVNAFIATLGTAAIISGATYLYSNSEPVVVTKAGFQTLGTGKWGGLQISVYVLAAIVVVGGVLLSRTVYGRRVYSTGGNLEAARLAGMRIDRIRISTYMITALCAAIGGMIVASQTGVGEATIGPDVTLDAIAIVIIGGTSLFGGEGAMWRTVIGILIYGTINNLFNSLALAQPAQSLVKGAILIGAVAIDSYSRRTRR
jgi:ribose transport system permease protein